MLLRWGCEVLYGWMSAVEATRRGGCPGRRWHPIKGPRCVHVMCIR